MTDHTTPTKTCTKCGKRYPEAAEFWHAHPKSKNGLNAQCKVCKCAYARSYYPGHADQVKRRARAWDLAHPELVRQRKRDWRNDNAEWAREYQRHWYHANLDKVRGYSWRYRQANRDACLARGRRWRDNNRERFRAMQRRWDSKHPDRRRANKRASEARRRARKHEAGGTYTAKDIALMLRTQKRRCWYCQCDISDGYEIDHRIPLSRGGTNAPSNLVLACAPCNHSKYDKTPDEWNGRLL